MRGSAAANACINSKPLGRTHPDREHRDVCAALGAKSSSGKVSNTKVQTAMPLPYSTAKKLRIQFQKSIRRGFVKNAEIDPQLSAGIAHLTEPGESFVVRVERTKGGRYWFSDRRVVFEDVATAQEVFRYQAVRRIYWMFKNLKERLIADPPNITNLKTTHFDRLEIDIGMGECVLDGLGQAYDPTLGFLQWMLKPRRQ